MTNRPIRVGLDLSRLVPQPLVGVGYYTLHAVQDLLEHHPEGDVRLFASSAQAAPGVLRQLPPPARASSCTWRHSADALARAYRVPSGRED